MQIGPDWVDSVNYWLRRYRAQSAGGYQFPGPSGGPIPPRLAYFELKTDLLPGQTCDAYLRLCQPGGAWQTDTAQITRLVDRLGSLRALGRDTTGSVGAMAIGWHDDFLGSDQQAQDVWIVAGVQQLARMIQIVAPANEAAAAIFQVTSCTCLDDGQSPCTNGIQANVTNWGLKLCAGATATCLADGNGGYLVIDAPCPTC